MEDFQKPRESRASAHPKTADMEIEKRFFVLFFLPEKDTNMHKPTLAPQFNAQTDIRSNSVLRNSDAIAASRREREGARMPSGKWQSLRLLRLASFGSGALAAKLADFVCHCAVSREIGDSVLCRPHERSQAGTNNGAASGDASHTFPVASWLSGTGWSPGHRMRRPGQSQARTRPAWCSLAPEARSNSFQTDSQKEQLVCPGSSHRLT